MIGGFTPGYHWILVFENRKRGGSLPFQIHAQNVGDFLRDVIAGFTPGYHWLLIFQNR